jgi:3-hydroxyacyl-CoA dehydrogenase
VGLQGRIIGYHFYNPPIVQKLVEIIAGKDTKNDVKEIADEMGKRLRKKLIPSNDIAGFIGNGHFSRDGLLGIAEVQRIQDKYSFPEAVYIINRITQDFLIRPMGIFQLIDYVGIDVFQSILRVMKKHLKDASLHSDLIDTFMQKNVKGGQHADGSQKDGFLQYQKSRPVGIYDVEKDGYVGIEEIKKKCDPDMGEPPDGFMPWRKLVGDSNKDSVLADYFSNLRSAEGVGSELARRFLSATKKIGEKLVEDGVASNQEDVNAVLINGFYWLYGPVNDYI